MSGFIRNDERRICTPTRSLQHETIKHIVLVSICPGTYACDSAFPARTQNLHSSSFATAQNRQTYLVLSESAPSSRLLPWALPRVGGVQKQPVANFSAPALGPAR
eukprot:15454124-Alexandrium_andersonii.AAC.3